MKRIISAVLVIAVIFGLMAGMAVNSNAATDVWETEPNENPNQTNSLQFGQIMHGNTMSYKYGSNEDNFKITTADSINFRIKFDHEINYTYGAGWCLVLYKLNTETNSYYDYFNNSQYSSYSYEYYDKVISDEGISYSPIINAQKGDIFVLRVISEYGGTQQQNVNYMISIEPYIIKVSGLKCASRKTNTQKVAWNKVSGASGYQVQRSNNGGTSWSDYYYTNSNSFVFNYLTAGGKYKFRARAYKTISGKDYYGAWSSTLCSCCTPAKPTLKKVSSPKHTQIKTAWAKASGTKSGYQILYGKNASFSSIAAKKKVSASKSSYTGKNFTKGRTYYVKVRTYTNFGGKTYYSAWSSAKKVKCK